LNKIIIFKFNAEQSCDYSTLSSPNLEHLVQLGFSVQPINIILYLNYIFNKFLYNINVINLVIKFYDIVLIYINYSSFQ